MNTKDFFEFLYPNLSISGQKIELRPIDAHTNLPATRYRVFTNNIDKIIELSNNADHEKKYHIFFECPLLKGSATSGTESNVVCYPFLYADVDPCKKDKAGNVIQTFSKAELMDRIKKFPIEPSIIVDSGYGYHCYWALLFPIYSVKVAKILLTTICKQIGGDNKASHTTQLLRVPNTHNCKTQRALLCKVVSFNDKRYDKELFYETLNIDSAAEDDKQEKKTDADYIQTNTSIKFTFDNPAQKATIKADEYDMFLDMLKKQNMFKCTNLKSYQPGKAFNCCFHDDAKPSANIFKTKEGYYMYYCFACGATYDIISIYQKVKKVNFFDALDQLASYFGISYSLSDWVKSQIMKYHTNAQWLGGIEKNHQRKQYPNLFKIIDNKLHYLRMINSYAQEKPISKNLMHDGDSIFFASYEFLTAFGHHATANSIYTTYKNVNLLAALGLIDKIPIDELSYKVQLKVRQQVINRSEQISHITNKIAEPITFYKVPLFQDRLIEAERRAILLYKGKVNTRDISKETIILHLGQEIADQVYHDERGISKTNEKLAQYLKNTLIKLIDENGFATKELIAKKTKEPGRLKVCSKSKLIEVDKRLSSWLNELKLSYHRAKKDEMSKFGLKSSSYIITAQR